MNQVIIANEQDIDNVISRVVQDISYLEENKLVISDEFPKKLHIKLVGEKFDSSITSSVMKGLLELQKSIYHLYAYSTYGDASKRLTQEEKSRLELVVEVREGSAELFLELLPVLKEALKQMTGAQVLAGMGILGAVYLAGKISTALIQANKEKSVEIERQITEQQKQITEQQKQITQQKDNDNKIKAHENSLDALKEVVSITQDAQVKMFRSISKAPFSSIQVNDESFSHEDIVSQVKSERVKIKPYQNVISGWYFVTRLDFDDDETYVYLIDKDTKREIKKVAVQAAFISEQDYALIEGAKDREAIHLRLMVTWKADDIISAVIESILKDDQTRI